MTEQLIGAYATAIVAIITAVGGQAVAIIKANKAQSTADTNHEETRARLDDLESGRTPVKVSEPVTTATDEAA